MVKKGERDPRYTDTTLFDPQRAEQELKGAFWIVCPVHGVRKAVGVIQWPQELSDEMRAGIDARWFYRGRYTSGNCAECGLTLSVTRKKPVIK